MKKILDDRLQHHSAGVVILHDRSVTLGLWHLDVGLPYSTFQRVVVNVLQHSNHCARRLPRAVTENEAARMVPVSDSCNILV
jgi:hypothetical protein